MLPPGDSLRFHFDTYTDRLDSDLAMQYAVTVTYPSTRWTTAAS